MDHNFDDVNSFDSAGVDTRSKSASAGHLSKHGGSSQSYNIIFDAFVQEMTSKGYVALYMKEKSFSGNLRYLMKLTEIERGFEAQGLTYLNVSGVEITEQALNNCIREKLIRSDKLPEITGIIQIIDGSRSIIEDYEDEAPLMYFESKSIIDVLPKSFFGDVILTQKLNLSTTSNNWKLKRENPSMTSLSLMKGAFMA